MKSKTLSSNLTLFKKDITRFSPLWLVWSVMFLICGYLMYSSGYDLTNRYDIMPTEFTFANMIYGFGCAVMLFGYLFDPKECITTHSLPIRRENQFLIHLLSGFVMHIVPSAIFCLSIAPICQGNVFAMFGFMVLQFTFYFGLGIFCVMLTGRKFAAAAMFGLINFAAPLAYMAIYILYIPMLPGIELRTNTFMQFCPPVSMIYKSFDYSDVWEVNADFSAYTQTIAIFAAIGVGLMIAALVLYRIRKLECAESFMAFPCLNILFVLVCTLFGGCFLVSLFALFSEESFWVMLGFGIVIGYFAALMLLKRSPKVFNKKSIAGVAVIGILVAGSIFVTKMDLLGRVSYIPNAGDVAKAELFHYEGNTSRYFTEDPEEIVKFEQLHQDLIAQGPVKDPDYSSPSEYPQHVELLYHMKDGSTLKREYNPVDPVDKQVGWYMSQPEYLLGVSTMDELLEKTESCYVHIFYPNEGYREDMPSPLNKTDSESLLKVLFDDCKAGNMSAFSHYEDETPTYEVEIGLKDPGNPKNHENEPYAYQATLYLRISPKSANTIAWIEQYLEKHPSTP